MLGVLALLALGARPPTAYEAAIAGLEQRARDTTPTAAELADLALACDRLWALDANRLTPGADYELDLQGRARAWESGVDHARRPLFKWVREGAIAGPTWAAFGRLLDNYDRSVGVDEVVTREKLRQDAAFLDAILRTPCVEYARKYLKAKGLARARDAARFKELLFEKWLRVYSRSRGHLDSSGFEHVFLGEEKDGKVTGLHNWLRMYLEEKAGRLNYLGHFAPRAAAAKKSGGGRARDAGLAPESRQLVTVQFAWGAEVKSVSSSLVGTSPEFEIALYTLCFLAWGRG